MYPHEMHISKPNNVRRIEHVSPQEHPALYSSSQWTLNITRAEMAKWGHCPSGRFFEAAACGTPILTDEWDGLSDFFDLDSELLVVRDTEDVMQALKMDSASRESIAQRARRRTLDEHTGMVRARQFIRACEDAAALDLTHMKVQSEAAS
jgi:spore maturation protein CgeB